MTEVQPLTDEEIAEIEASSREVVSLWAEALRQRDEALAERDKWRQIAYDQAMLLLASCDDWMSRNVDAINVQMEQYRDEAVALLADVEAYFHNGIDLNDLISYALRRATNPGA